jgi:hypothetical protein
MDENFEILKNCSRTNLVDLISNENNPNIIGIELGVAKGLFSKELIDTGKFEYLFGIDKYSDYHNTQEYINAIKYVGISSNYKLIRSTFDEALELFDDEFFNFIYIDGYAHNGQLGGETIVKWYDKLKIKGLMCGDDYTDKFPLVKEAVNYIAQKHKLKVLLTDLNAENSGHEFQSWAIIKENNSSLSTSTILKKKSKIFDFYFNNKKKIKKIYKKQEQTIKNFIKRKIGR